MFLDFIEKLFNQANVIKAKQGFVENNNVILQDLLEPAEEKIDLKNILAQQNYHGPDKTRFKRLVKELDIQEPIEELIALLTK